MRMADERHPAASVQTRTLQLGNARLHVFCERFSDRVLVLITTTGRVGCWVRSWFVGCVFEWAWKCLDLDPNTALSSSHPTLCVHQLLGSSLATQGGRPTFELTPLLGASSDDWWTSTLARQLLEDMNRKNCSKSLLLGVTLDESCRNADTVCHLVQEIAACGAW